MICESCPLGEAEEYQAEINALSERVAQLHAALMESAIARESIHNHAAPLAPATLGEMLEMRPITELIAEAVAKEREACAKLCDDVSTYDPHDIAGYVAEQIRARGKP